MLNYLFSKQSEKYFISCLNGIFDIEQIRKYMSLDNLVINHTHNTIILTTPEVIFKLLLRWKNYKGCSGPAWQIGIRKK